MWAVAGTVLACVAALVMGVVVSLLTRGAAAGRSRATVFAAAFPFVCLGWAALLFGFQAVVNASMGRDAGLGDSWHCPLPNGYALLMIDVTDQGWVYNPKTQGGGNSVTEREDSVSGVRKVQVSGRYILAGVDSHAFENLGKETEQIDSYFILDTQTGRRTNLSSYDALRTSASNLGINLNIEPIYSVYSRYRFTWFDVVVGVSLLLLPLIIFALLARFVIRTRKSRSQATQPATV